MLLSIFDFFSYYFLQEQMPAYGEWACNLSSRWAFQLFPSTHTIKSLSDQLSGNIPFLGDYLIFKMINNIWDLLWCVATYKVIKIMPGKF